MLPRVRPGHLQRPVPHAPGGPRAVRPAPGRRGRHPERRGLRRRSRRERGDGLNKSRSGPFSPDGEGLARVPGQSRAARRWVVPRGDGAANSGAAGAVSVPARCSGGEQVPAALTGGDPLAILLCDGRARAPPRPAPMARLAQIRPGSPSRRRRPPRALSAWRRRDRLLPRHSAAPARASGSSIRAADGGAPAIDAPCRRRARSASPSRARISAPSPSPLGDGGATRTLATARPSRPAPAAAACPATTRRAPPRGATSPRCAATSHRAGRVAPRLHVRPDPDVPRRPVRLAPALRHRDGHRHRRRRRGMTRSP